MSIKAGTEGGGAFKRRRKTPTTAQPTKPFRPVENPFPEKRGFRFGQYRVLEEKDDYLICVGYDPNAKDPAAEITPAAPRTIKVAKPPALQRTPWDGKSVDIGGTTYTYEYSNEEYGVRTVRWTDDDGEEQEEEQRIDIPYTLGNEAEDDEDEEDDTQVSGQIILAAEVRKSAAVDGTDFRENDRDDEGNITDEGGRLRWMDLNVSGRHWAAERSSVTEAEDDDGFPPGTNGCECNCVEGVAMPASSTVCCRAHLTYKVVTTNNGLFGMHWTSGNVWLSDEFDGEQCEVAAANAGVCGALGGEWDAATSKCYQHNVYKAKLTVSASDWGSVWEYLLVTDNGCEDECYVYKSPNPWRCLCDNVMELVDWDNPYGHPPACHICVKAHPGDPVYGTCFEDGGPQIVPVSYIIDDLTLTSPAPFPGPTCSGSGGGGGGGGAWTDCGTGVGGDIELPRTSIIGFGYGKTLTEWEEPEGDYVEVELTIEPIGDGNCRLVLRFIRTPPFFGTTEAAVYSYDITGQYEPASAYTLSYDSGCCDGWPAVITIIPVGAGTPPTSSGSCAGCTTSAAPADAAGACCIDATCYDVSEADCTTLAGEWFSDDASCDAGCEGAALGACCIETLDNPGTRRCIITTEAYCSPGSPLNPIFAAWFPDGTCPDCDDFGACCDGGECTITDSAGCAGDWSEDMTCEEVVCAQTGCCCWCTDLGDCPGTCTSDELTEAECTANSGDWAGAGTACGGLPGQYQCDSGCNAFET